MLMSKVLEEFYIFWKLSILWQIFSRILLVSVGAYNAIDGAKYRRLKFRESAHRHNIFPPETPTIVVYSLRSETSS